MLWYDVWNPTGSSIRETDIREEFNERKTGRGYCDRRCHSAKERLTRFRAVDLSSGKELFSKAIGNWTNNIGEFLGIVEAVRYVMEHPESPRTIYSDSITAITWYRNKQTASSRRCPALQKAEIFLKVMEARIKDIEVLHWDNRLWGEIPADFGNK